MGCQTLLIVIAALLFSCNGQYSWEHIQNSTSKIKKLPNLDSCGVSDSDFGTKNSNAKKVERGAYPWIANLGYVNGQNEELLWLCAGSLITDRYVLTSARCIDPESLRSRQFNLTTVRVGELDLNSTEDGANPVDYEVQTYVFHEDYNNDRKTNDIGLVRTKEEVKFTAFIRPICLPSSVFLTEDFIGHTPTLAGWGRSIDSHSQPKNMLQQADVEIKDTSDCKANLTTKLKQAALEKRVLCADFIGRDSCQGDSGGPLMYIQKNATTSKMNVYLMGIVVEGHPGIYTRVAKYMPWIIDKMDL